MKRFIASILSLGLLATLGCYQIEDIDRTQPNKVLKSIFQDGEDWFFRQTIIDVPATAELGFWGTFIGEQGGNERVRFEIQENFLFAYRSYPFQPGGDGDVRPGTGAFTDNPVAAFRIQMHFDVQRQYNPATGEQTNVIVENMVDRPWYEREYMRVDWSNNLIADFEFTGSAVRQQPVTFAVPEEDDPSRPSKDQAKIGEDYLDIFFNDTATTEIYTLYSNYFGFPILECWFFTGIHKDCKGAEIRVRSSFMKAEPSDYMPVDYDDRRYAKFGLFRSERFGFDQDYGIVEGAVQRMVNRHNLWRDAQSCYDAEAALPYGACSPDQLRTIVYYLNEDFPTKLRSGAIDNGDEWNRVFTEAVLDATGWDADELGDKRLFTICANNPVQVGDPAECGPAGTNPQIGDLRYSMYYYVPDVQSGSPLGYGPSAADPLTGEIIQANAFYYGYVGRILAARVKDLVELDLGILEMEDLGDGLPARNAIQNIRNREDARVRDFRENFDRDRIRDFTERTDLRMKGERLRHQIETGEAFVDMRPARMERLEQSGLDEMLFTNDIKQQVAGLGVTDADDNFQGIQDLKPLLSEKLFDMEKERIQRLMTPKANGCILMADDVFDAAFMGMINSVKREFYDTTVEPPVLKDGKTAEDVLSFIEMRVMMDTQLHEIGHTVGLAHNFASSTDALNFDREYWTLRGPGFTMSNADPRPRPLWELTGAFADGYDQAVNSGIFDHQNTSTMEYASTYGTRLELGNYDRAAIKYAYLDTVETFNSPDVDEERRALLRPGDLHYTWYPELISDAATYEERVDAMYDRSTVNWRFTDPEQELYNPELFEVPYRFCDNYILDGSSTCAIWDSGADNYERTLKMVQDYKAYHIIDAFKRERVTFGLDVFSYLSRVYGRRFSYILTQYKNWVNDELIIRDGEPCVTYEGGQRVEESDRFQATACGMAGLLGAAEAVNLFGEIIQQPDVGCYVRLETGSYITETFNQDGMDGTPIRKLDDDPAACNGFVSNDPDNENLVCIAIEGNSSMIHIEDSTSCEGFEPILDSDTGAQLSRDPVEIPYGFGRPSITRYDRDRYGYFFYMKALNMGSWWDKWLAVKALGDPWTDFIGVDASSDTRSFLISLNTLFGDDINNLLAGVVTDDVSVYGAYINDDNEPEFIETLALFAPFDREANTQPFLNPDQQYTFRLLAMFNAVYQQQITDDLEFSEGLQIGRAYNVTNLDIPDEILNDPTRYVELTDLENGYKYFAIRQDRGEEGSPIYSAGYEFVRQIKDNFYVGGADGPGLELKEGVATFQPQGDIRILEIMRQTRNTFGRPDVWEGDLPF
jgi:hypothetical protein